MFSSEHSLDCTRFLWRLKNGVTECIKGVDMIPDEDGLLTIQNAMNSSKLRSINSPVCTNREISRLRSDGYK